jgi:hypothetical protein
LNIYYVDHNQNGKLCELFTSDGGQTYTQGGLDAQTNLFPASGGAVTAAGMNDGQNINVYVVQKGSSAITQAHWDGQTWSTTTIL